jgi:hypothetical protein
MRHATPVVLDALEPLLAQLRRYDALTERKRGVFYRRSAAFLHFPEDPAGFFADVRIGPGWVRLPATTAADRRSLIRQVRAELGAPSPARS